MDGFLIEKRNSLDLTMFSEICWCTDNRVGTENLRKNYVFLNNSTSNNKQIT